jgi:hypothetical protein
VDNRVDPVAQLADEASSAAAEPDTTVRKTDQVKAENGRKSPNGRDSGGKLADKTPAAGSAGSDSAGPDASESDSAVSDASGSDASGSAAASDSASDSAPASGFASAPGFETTSAAGGPGSASGGAAPAPVGNASDSDTTRPRFVANSFASGKTTPPPSTDAASAGSPQSASTADDDPDSPAALAAAALAADASSKGFSGSGSPASGSTSPGTSAAGYPSSGYPAGGYSGSSSASGSPSGGSSSGGSSSNGGSGAGTPSWPSSGSASAAAGKPAYSPAEPLNTDADPSSSAQGFANNPQVTGYFSDPRPAPTPSPSVPSNGLKSKITAPFAIPTLRKPKPGRAGRQGSAINTGKTATVKSKPAPDRRPPAGLSPDGSRPGQSEARRDAQLVVARIEPWSVMKFSFMVSLVAWVILFVAVAVLYFLLSSLGVFHAIENTIGTVTSTKTSAGSNASSWFSASTVLGYTMIAGTVNIILITALSTLGAVVYNVVTRLAGGVEVTLAEAD